MLTGLFRFQTNIETCWKAIFLDAGISAGIHNEVANLVTPFVALTYQHQGPTGHRIQIDDGSWRHDGFRGLLRCSVATNRIDNVADHDTFVQDTYALLVDWDGLINHGNCPWYHVLLMEEAGISTTNDSESRMDVSELAFNMIFGIRPTAWNYREPESVIPVVYMVDSDGVFMTDGDGSRMTI